MIRVIAIIFLMRIALAGRGAETTNSFLATVPEGYFLQAYDDCGIEGRQPHVLMKDCYLWTFGTSDTEADIKERSAVFSYKSISAVYTNLDPNFSYALALTYASDHVYKRVQSLEANGNVLHGPYALPMAKATRVIVRVPPEATRDGKMTLTWKIHGEVNATVSIIELWANAPSPRSLEISSVSGLSSSLEGQVVDLAYNGVSGAKVSMVAQDLSPAASTTTDASGYFTFDRKLVEQHATGGTVTLTTKHKGQEGRLNLPTNHLFFAPVQFRPMPETTGGLKQNRILLDGTWKLRSAVNSNWTAFKVPGQWLQQGFDIPKDQSVFVAKSFFIPSEWSGNRLILRFDGVHAGTHYRLNGHDLGYSENLFTPVEWDITERAKIGQTNILDLKMKVATVSEQMSFSSDYAFHNLGGIDRSVRIFALPPTHVRQMRVQAGLDASFHDGELRLNLLLENEQPPAQDLSLAVRLVDPNGKTEHSISRTTVEPFSGSKAVNLFTRIAHPLPWSAEKPFLYKLVLELQQGRKVLERVERQIGFRQIEIRGTEFFVNGRIVKFAGACHHEYDPLTGRAATMRHAEEDVRLMKGANLNYIRTSHYPPTQELLDAADRLGMYVEVEAPFCWVGGALDTAANLSATLIPTSAMIDYCHSHPSVIVWSLANESHFNRQFFHAAKMAKELDPTRPTTFNFDFANNPLCKVTDIANWHYPTWPWTNIFAGDPRPLFFGEFFFPVCHEQTDVRIDPGLRELWGHGHAEPESEFAKAQAAEFAKPPVKPGIPPGEWSRMFHSDRVMGGAIWASHDDAFYFPDGKTAGYAWHHGFWGLIDSWRRPKPEWWMARHIFSPVWIETRQVAFAVGQKSIRVPVENHYAFTDFSELNFQWQIGKKTGKATFRLAPATKGELEISIPRGTTPGEKVLLRVTGQPGSIVHESSIQLGEEKPMLLPKPLDGAPQWSEDGNKIVIQGQNFSAVFDRTKGDFDASDSRHLCAVQAFPTFHLTRYDFGDLNGPNSPPYAVFPDAKTRGFEKADIQAETSGLRITIHEKFDGFAGSTSWLMDRNGKGTVSCDYIYSGPTMDTREAGIRFRLRPACDELKWRRWSEWGVFPPEDISRTEGTARARRDKKFGEAQWDKRPSWPWSQDETEQGTADFRSVKFNIYEASLAAKDGGGLRVRGKADVHFRAALAGDGINAHVLSRCPLGQVPIRSGDHLRAEFNVQLEQP